MLKVDVVLTALFNLLCGVTH